MPSFPSGVTLNDSVKKHLLYAVSRLDLNLSPSLTIQRAKAHRWTWQQEGHYALLLLLAIINLSYAESPTLLFKILMVAAYVTAALVPLTSQFVLPASIIFSWLLLFWSSKYIPVRVRPHIWVTLLPTLESVLYGANISDILTRTMNPFLDVLAWVPYGIIHFAAPFVVAATLFVFGPPGAINFFGKAFGYLNLVGVMIQVAVPCTPPWYELQYGLTPAHYGMPGSPGGLARIDAIFHSHGYTNTFTTAPIPFGAFPSLHAGCGTMEALFMSHFFPAGRVAYWSYVLWLYWTTMYLTHHYLIDLVAGAALAVGCFYLLMSEEMRHAPALAADKTSYIPHSSSTSSGDAYQLTALDEHELDDEELDHAQFGPVDKSAIVQSKATRSLSPPSNGARVASPRPATKDIEAGDIGRARSPRP
ncbi:uncharacterized protein L969DRAFT_315445 [Mixia osmundae IAM 14324]|uniref:Phosphatidic acid phosphatase type 2/haloperoxidase domain-containing protein n=1 Tax=Mixia osmundae (strain CBS 9802 / IAM 14324 / JCM 22182 / KY 12970) TaxID=764103 RepID=G7DYJ9_MIXOS|nr:uncharacterized protein L969DRAFT_315445 [Mixia osmundae IAM 14324]KEI41558.1 hypothetical protein L969DRAFT_315445 [Mixia osmundae IAM 14324]GAA95659.1 hypothetical protein E5Q_02315 [Mixia osmundae IAM 14324]